MGMSRKNVAKWMIEEEIKRTRRRVSTAVCQKRETENLINSGYV